MSMSSMTRLLETCGVWPFETDAPFTQALTADTAVLERATLKKSPFPDGNSMNHHVYVNKGAAGRCR